MSGRLVRAVAPSGAPLRIFIDGAEATAYAGESVLDRVEWWLFAQGMNAVRRAFQVRWQGCVRQPALC